ALITGTAVAFTGLLAVAPVHAIDAYKAPRALAALVQEQRTEPEIRIATYRYFQPSLVFYCRREVVQFTSEGQVADFLGRHLPAFSMLPSPVGDDLQTKVALPPREPGRHRALYRNCEVVLICNR